MPPPTDHLEILDGLLEVLVNAFADGVHVAQLDHGFVVVLAGSAPIPGLQSNAQIRPPLKSRAGGGREGEKTHRAYAHVRALREASGAYAAAAAANTRGKLCRAASTPLRVQRCWRGERQHRGLGFGVGPWLGFGVALMLSSG